MSKLSDVFKKIVGQVAPYAPAIATALGGPGAGAAVAALSHVVLGHGNGTADDVAAALEAAQPELFTKIRAADQTFELEQQRIAADDRKSARQREIDAHDSWTPRALAGLVVIGAFVGEGYAMTHAIPTGSEMLVGRVLGTLDGALMLVLAYYFGSSAGSAAKNRILGAS